MQRAALIRSHLRQDPREIGENQVSDEAKIDPADLPSLRANIEETSVPERMSDEELEKMLDEIKAKDAEQEAKEAAEKAARLAAFEAQYPENIRIVARKIAEQRGADPDAPIGTRDGEFEWAWVAYAGQASELVKLQEGA